MKKKSLKKVSETKTILKTGYAAGKIIIGVNSIIIYYFPSLSFLSTVWYNMVGKEQASVRSRCSRFLHSDHFQRQKSDRSLWKLCLPRTQHMYLGFI